MSKLFHRMTALHWETSSKDRIHSFLLAGIVRDSNDSIRVVGISTPYFADYHTKEEVYQEIVKDHTDEAIIEYVQSDHPDLTKEQIHNMEPVKPEHLENEVAKNKKAEIYKEHKVVEDE